MLTCRQMAGIASDYIDGELGPMQRLSVKTHLVMCKDCRHFIANLRASVELMKGHSSTRTDDAFIQQIDERVLQALEDRNRPED